jgi:uncharacterized protein with GYD domain
MDKFWLQRLPLLPSSGTYSFLSVLEVDDDSNIQAIHITLPSSGITN